MTDRRSHALVDRTGALPEALFRQQVDDALQRIAKLIAANTTADAALGNRVTELEDAPAGYTAENARDDVGAALVASTGVSIVVSDIGDTITVSSTITQYTDENARDAIGTALTAGHGIDITVNDGADTITVDVDESELNFATPVAAGLTLSAGSADTLSRSDHVHTVPASVVNAARVIYEIDFSTLANLSLVNGSNTINSRTVTGANLATNLSTSDILNGTGLRLISSGSATAATLTSTSQGSPLLYWTLGDIPNWDGRTDVLVEFHLSALTLEQNNEFIALGFYNVANSPGTGDAAWMRWAGVMNNSGTRVQRTMIQATGANSNAAATGYDVIGLKITAAGLCTPLVGTWSAGWPAQMTQLATMTTLATSGQVIMNGNTRIVLSLGVVSDGTPTTAVTAHDMRVSLMA